MYSSDKGINWSLTAKTPDIDIRLQSLCFGNDIWISVALTCMFCNDDYRIIRILDTDILDITKSWNLIETDFTTVDDKVLLVLRILFKY